MPTIDEFKALIGKEITATIAELGEAGGELATAADALSTVLTVDKVEAGAPIECDDPNVCGEPFAVVLSGPLDKRLPESIYKFTGEGLGECFTYLDPMIDDNVNDDRLPYEAIFA